MAGPSGSTRAERARPSAARPMSALAGYVAVWHTRRRSNVGSSWPWIVARHGRWKRRGTRRGGVGVSLGAPVGYGDTVGTADGEAAAQVAVIACASHDESPSNSQLVDAAAAARSPSGSARRYSSEKVELPPHSSQAKSSSAPSPTYIRSCHASSSDEYQR